MSPHTLDADNESGASWRRPRPQPIPRSAEPSAIFGRRSHGHW